MADRHWFSDCVSRCALASGDREPFDAGLVHERPPSTAPRETNFVPADPLLNAGLLTAGLLTAGHLAAVTAWTAGVPRSVVMA